MEPERERDWKRGGERNNGSIVVRGEQGVIISVVVLFDNGKMPIVGSSRVLPTLKDGGACLVVGLDIVLGEGDSEVCIARGAMLTRVLGKDGMMWPWRAEGGRFLSLR